MLTHTHTMRVLTGASHRYTHVHVLTQAHAHAQSHAGPSAPRPSLPQVGSPPPDRANRVTRPTLLRVLVCSEDPSVLQRAPRLTAPTLYPAVPPSPRSHLAALPAQRIPSTVPLHRTHPPPPPLAVLRRPRPPDPRRPSAGSPHTHSSERPPVLVTGSQLWSSTCLSNGSRAHGQTHVRGALNVLPQQKPRT